MAAIGCQDESDGLWNASKVLSIKGLGHSVAECCEAERVLTKALFETLGHDLVSLGLGKSYENHEQSDPDGSKPGKTYDFPQDFIFGYGDAPILAFK